MRDSRHGTFGVVAIVFSVLLRASALAEIGEPIYAGLALIAAHAASRAALPVAMFVLAPARADGLGAAAGRPSALLAIGALAIGLLTTLAALGLDPEAALAFTIENCSITRIDHIEGPGMGHGWRVVTVNRPPR